MQMGEAGYGGRLFDHVHPQQYMQHLPHGENQQHARKLCANQQQPNAKPRRYARKLSANQQPPLNQQQYMHNPQPAANQQDVVRQPQAQTIAGITIPTYTDWELAKKWGWDKVAVARNGCGRLCNALRGSCSCIKQSIGAKLRKHKRALYCGWVVFLGAQTVPICFTLLRPCLGAIVFTANGIKCFAELALRGANHAPSISFIKTEIGFVFRCVASLFGCIARVFG
jgi:hypothetical protein